MSSADKWNRPEVKLRRFDWLIIQLHEARGQVKAYRHARDSITAALEKGADVDLGEIRDEIAARMVDVVEEASQLAEALERVAPGITQRLLDSRSLDDVD